MNTRRQHTRRHGIRHLGILIASLGLLAGFTACSSDSDRSDRSDRSSSTFLSEDSTSPSEPGEAPTEGSGVEPREGSPDAGGADSDAQGDSAPSSTAPEAERNSAPGERRRTAPSERAVIQTGNVSIASEKVGDSRFDAKEIADRHSGEIAEEETGTRDGEVSRVRMVIRVPQENFDDLMTDLAELGELRSATRSSEDVSTQVVDTRSRIKSQERSIARIQSLLAEAEDLREVISIESQLASRQADLDSLKSQLAWLEDQSSLSTVTLSLSATDSEEATDEEDEETGFLAGFERGWDGLVGVGSSLATNLGVVLPFSLALGVLLVPVWLLIRRRPRRERNIAAPTASA